MKETKYDAEIKELESQVELLEAKLNALNQMRAEELCPLKVGDIVVSKNGKEAKITAIYPRFGEYAMNGAYINKNGLAGKANHRLYGWDNWQIKK
jgi:hypothetical protein